MLVLFASRVLSRLLAPALQPMRDKIEATHTVVHQILGRTRRAPKVADVNTHRRMLEAEGYICPVCRCHKDCMAFEVDHFFSCEVATVTSIWVICKDCHLTVTTGKRSRLSLLPAFSLYMQRLHTYGSNVMPGQMAFNL